MTDLQHCLSYTDLHEPSPHTLSTASESAVHERTVAVRQSDDGTMNPSPLVGYE
jgi:hypothetical protein